MDPLSPLDGIAELIRRKIASEGSGKTDFRSLTKTANSATKSAVSQKSNFPGLKIKILEQVKAINVNDPKREHKAVKLFVQNILIWQFGEELLNDPSFTNLVDKVTAALESDPSVVQQLLHMAKA